MASIFRSAVAPHGDVYGRGGEACRASCGAGRSGGGWRSGVNFSTDQRRYWIELFCFRYHVGLGVLRLLQLVLVVVTDCVPFWVGKR